MHEVYVFPDFVVPLCKQRTVCVVEKKITIMFFKDIIGQDEVKRRLINSVDSGHIAHAQLLCGPEGVGKFAMALAYARYIHCANRRDGEACGECPSCKQHSALTHPDLHFVFPMVKVDKKKRICDDYLPEWSEFLKENTYFGLDTWLKHISADNKQAVIYGEESESILRKMSLKSYGSPYKIMIIWLPERMNDTCANKLLKLLEEPYPGSVFLLVSNNPARVLGTIQSRSQLIEMRALSSHVIAEALQRQYGIGEQDAKAVAHIADGSYLRACEALQLNEENQLFFNYFVAVMRLAYARRIKDLKAWSEEVADLGRERLRRFLSYAQRMIRENYIYNLHVPELSYMNTEEQQFSSRFAPFIHERNVQAIMQHLSDAENDIGQNANAKIVLFDLAIKLIMLLKS